MTGFANKIPFRFGLQMAPKAVAAEAVDDLGKSALVDRSAVFGHVEFEEFPIVCDFIKALGLLDHDLGRHELNHRTHRVHTAVGGFGYFQGARKISN